MDLEGFPVPNMPQELCLRDKLELKIPNFTEKGWLASEIAISTKGKRLD